MNETLIGNVVWDGRDLQLMEHSSLWRITNGYLLRGTSVGILNQVQLTVRYEVECEAFWHTRRVHVDAWIPPITRQIDVAVDDKAHWIVDGQKRKDLEGLIDVDIQITPSTNILPIRRMGLGVGEHADVTAAWIEIPSLTISPLPQRYTRTAQNRYEYCSGDFNADLQLGPESMIEEYGTFWRRLTL